MKHYNSTDLLVSRHQKNIDFVQKRLTPYLLIVLFSATITILRVYLLESWRWYHHLAGFLAQVIALAGIWNLIKFLNSVLERKIPFSKGPLQRIFIQVFLTLVIISPVIGATILIMKPYLPPFVNQQFLVVMIVLFCLVIILFNFSFLAAWFFRNWQLSVEEKAKLEVQAATLEREKFNLQYHQLKNQVNPHYLFNTLSSLDGLIHTDPDLASDFIRHMSKVYRYVLRHKENEIVSLEEELEFIGHYIQLLKLRYQEGLKIQLDISEAAKEKGVVMVTLQMLLDNAIKHNIVQNTQPLSILINHAGDYLIVKNNKQVRKQIETSNGTGLAQLKLLYSYLSEKPVLVEEDDQSFILKIPLLDHENTGA